MRGAKASILLRQRDYRAPLVERGGEFVDLRMSYDTCTNPSALPPPSVLVGPEMWETMENAAAKPTSDQMDRHDSC